MKTVITSPVKGGRVRAIPSKSMAHRMLICACLSGLDITGICEGLSEDISSTKECLKALCEGLHGSTYNGPCSDPSENSGMVSHLNCRESGSTLRFLLPISAVLAEKACLEGSGRLMQRPLKELEDELIAHGCEIRRQEEAGKESGIMVSGKLCGGEFTLPGNVSSQYISGLLFALPLLDEDSRIRIKGELQSKPYVDMTLDALNRSGIRVRETAGDKEREYEVPGGQTYGLGSLRDEDIEGDWSNGAFWLAAGALGADVECTGLSHRSLQGDRQIVEIIEKCREPGDIIFDVGQIPDLVPAMALLAMGRGEGEATKIVNAGRLRMKESDRIESVVSAVESLGGCAKATDETITILGIGDRRLTPVRPVDSSNDHRIVMMAAIGALLCNAPVEIESSQAVRKSYPGFFDDYISLGGNIEVYEI